jgi:hypothetical protein
MTLPEKPSSPKENKPSGQPIPKTGFDFPADPGLPDDFTPLVRSDDLASSSRARRRRARRSLVPPGTDERTALLDDLARRSFPSVDFFLFALLCGLLMGAGYLLDSHAILLMALLVAPILAPWIGMTLATVTGGWRFFFQTLSSLVIAFLLAFFSSALIGLFNRVMDFSRFNRASDHAKLWWTDLLIVVLGAVLLELVHVRGNRKPILPSIMLAYGFFLPLGAAGFAWGGGLPGTWSDGILVFLTYLSLATLVGCVVLSTQHFKSPRRSGTILLVLVVLLCLSALVSFTGLAGWFADRAEPVDNQRTPTPLGLVSPTPGLPPSPTTGGPTRTSTDSPTAQPSSTPTSTLAPTYALITASTGGGALVRTEPGGGTVLTTLLNGTLVEVLPETRMIGTVQWAFIRTQAGLEGWVLQAVLALATPEPTLGITLTLTPKIP